MTTGHGLCAVILDVEALTISQGKVAIGQIANNSHLSNLGGNVFARPCSIHFIQILVAKLTLYDAL